MENNPIVFKLSNTLFKHDCPFSYLLVLINA